LPGPNAKPVPAPTPDRLSKWAEDDITFALAIGFLPDGDAIGGAMAQIVEDSTGRMSDANRAAIAVYIESLPARD
jgi:hypothetical protein